MEPSQRIFVGMCGSSGARYGRRFVEVLLGLGWEVGLCLSDAARKVLELEDGIRFDPRSQESLRETFGAGAAERLRAWDNAQIEAPAASGSALRRGAVIIPCSMGTLGSIAAGTSANLVERAADVMLKEGRPLVLVPRETPLSVVHLRNMTRLAEAGAVVLPAAPGFYHRPETIDDLVAHVVTKITDRLGVRLDLIERWGGG